MANTLTDLKDVRIAQAALMPWMTELMPLSIFSSNFGPTSADYDEFELEEIADTLNTYEENKAQADSYLKELEAGEESDNGYHEFLQGMADREIISLYENYGIVTNIKIEGWEPASR